MKLIKEYKFKNTDPALLKDQLKHIFSGPGTDIDDSSHDLLIICLSNASGQGNASPLPVSELIFRFKKELEDASVELQADLSRVEKLLKIIKYFILFADIVIVSIVFYFLSSHMEGDPLINIIITSVLIFSFLPVLFVIPRIKKNIFRSFENKMDDLFSKIIRT